MPILKYTASADTTITDAYNPNSLTRAFYANMGAADSLEIFSIYTSGSSPQKSRVLVQFPISQIIADRSSSILPASGSMQFVFNLYNVETPETLPSNYFVSIKPISASWDEGFGLDLESYRDIGQSGSTGYGVNWLYRSSENNGSAWVQQGGDFVSGYEKTFYFNNGTENISVDVTNIVEAQISGVIPPYGFAVMLSGAYEDGSNQTTYYTKRFSARSSEYFYRVPSLEARWESLLKDDRGNFFYYSPNLSDEDNTQNIYFYNRVNGTIKDIPNSVIPLVKIFDESDNLLTSSIQSTKIGTGRYKASFFITGSEEQTLKDVWFFNNSEYYTGSVSVYNRTFEDTIVPEETVLSLTNLKSSYESYEKPTIRIFGRYKDWSPTIYKVSSKDINTLTFKNLYYKVIRLVDGLSIIDYGISPVAYTLCSYDKNGNYFDLDMSIFEKGYGYGIKLMLKNEEIQKEYPIVFRFKVE